jgi:2-oxoglutarate dehydrogenase E2 component (dihydrolipoamide succinyltransferase)
MAGFGKYQVAQDMHIVTADAEFDVKAGEFEPADEAQAAAVLGLVGVSFQPEGAEQSHEMVTITEPPDAQTAAGTPDPTQVALAVPAQPDTAAPAPTDGAAAPADQPAAPAAAPAPIDTAGTTTPTQGI